ncbi:hypothetical protein CY656_03350 [Klebsiella pneumoniae]|nr:hypothetical protein CY656_03350 [Klebsiella pneumoniae]MBK3272246.1 hypothetical protein [Klebsiella pneumoniae]RLL31954.1 hypothetical protein D9K84_08280 [Klebsiella pneumoniae]HBY1624956.1 hypothetical protein [Klebsiella pneumoniae]HBY4308564.1 hypothetical protein [Klebsiella pneumoniae]
MQVWLRWTTAGWSNRVGHKSRGAATAAHFSWVLRAGRPATGRRARGKRLVFEFYRHHHHLLTD